MPKVFVPKFMTMTDSMFLHDSNGTCRFSSLHLCAPIVTELIISPELILVESTKNSAMTETRANLRGKKVLDEPQEE